MKSTLKLCLFFFLFIILVSVLMSCATSNKFKQVTKTTSDSTAVTRIDSSTSKTVDSAHVKKDNTITTVEKEDNYTKVTVIEFEKDSVQTDISRPIHADKIDPNDYFYFPAAVKKVTVTETGTKKEKAVTQNNIVDSGGKKETANTNLVKDQKTEVKKTAVQTTKKKFSINTTGLIISFCILLLLYLVYRYLKKRYPAFFGSNKNKKPDEYPVTKT